MRTKVEIESEANKLEEMKPSVRHSSVFGDDHHNAIDAQIRVLREHMSEDELYGEYGEDSEDFAENVLDAAIAAYQWMMDETTTAPNIDWQSLVKKP